MVALARAESTPDAGTDAPTAAADQDKAEADVAAARVSDTARIYLNRLSDLLFILGREFNRRDGRSDVLWKKSQ